MKNLKRAAWIVALLLACFVVALATVGSIITFTLGTTPGNPSSGHLTLWANSVSGLLECLNSAGTSCLNPGTVTINGGTDVLAAALANNTLILVTANVSQDTSALTLSQNNLTIQCMPGVSITRVTASVDLFHITGTNVRVTGCILDGNSVGNGIAATLNGTRQFIEHNTFQNWAVSASQNGLVSSQTGTTHEITDNFCLSEAQECFSTMASVSGVADHVWIQRNTITAWAGTANGAIHINNVGTTTQVIFVTDNSCTMANGSRNCIYAGASGGIPTDVLIEDNDCLVAGAISVVGCININAGQRWRVIGNNVNVDPTATVTFGINVSDCSGSSIVGNTILNAQTGLLFLDGSTTERGDCTVSGNTVGGWTLSSTQGGIVVGTVGLPNNRYVLSSNVLYFPSGAGTGYGILFLCDPGAFGGSGTPTCQNLSAKGNVIHGQSGAGSVGIKYGQANGGAMTFGYTVGNEIDAVGTGILVGASVADVKLGSQQFSNTTILYSDSGTRTHYDPQCHTYNISNSSTNLAVTQDGGPATTTAKAAALTQSLPLFTLSPLMVINGFTIKTATVFAGTATLVSTFGDSSGTATSYSSTTFNLQTAVSNTQFQDSGAGGVTLPKHVTEVGGNTFNLALTATTNNISSISAGSVDAGVCFSTR